MPQPEIKHLLKPGDRKGMLTLIARHHRKGYKWYWLCKCDCGKEKVINTSSVTKSCGCLRVEARTKHGLSRSRFYHIWLGMCCRCYKRYNTHYCRYGGAGIDIYSQWHKFQGFLSDMYKSYQEHCEKFGEKNTSIDRIDGKRGYWPDNVRWATLKEQANNTKANLKNKFIIDIDNKQINLLDFSKKYNLAVGLINKCIQDGYSTKEIIEKQYSKNTTRMISYKEIIQSNNILSSLPEKWKTIIELRYGILDNKFKTLGEVGAKLNLSRERIRQIENKAFNRILKIH